MVYPSGSDTIANEKVLADRLNTYKTADGKLALKGYTAYSNTVGALYDVELAARTMGLPENDVKMLLKGPSLIPDIAIIDPMFTMTAPKGPPPLFIFSTAKAIA